MLIPLKQWICDSCGMLIEKPEDGWWEYLKDSNTDTILGFRIVHQRKSCIYNEQAIRHEDIILGDMPVSSLASPGGFGHMLQWLELSETKKLGVRFDMTSYIEIMRRLYLPYWEQARKYWEQAYKDGYHDGCDFSENVLMSIINKYDTKLR